MMGLKGDGMDVVVGGMEAFQEDCLMEKAYTLSLNNNKDKLREAIGLYEMARSQKKEFISKNS